MAEPAITFGATSKFGTITGWNPQGATKTKTSQRASALDGKGNEVVSSLYDERTEYSQEFRANTVSAPTIPPTIGALIGECVLTGISISMSGTDFASMTLTGHQHRYHAHADTLQQASHGITLTSGFGAEDLLGGTAGDSADVESATVEITCQHKDSTDGSGNHLVGENYTAMITASTTWVGKPTIGVGAGWDETSEALVESNVDHVRVTYSATKALALDDPE